MLQKAKISLCPDMRSQKVSRYVYGHFIEHLGRCVYNGIWAGKDSPNGPRRGRIENYDGLRSFTVAALKKIKMPCLRWPGGCFADGYHWMDGIGPAAKRPKRYSFWSLRHRLAESNQFGTDEFLRFCEMIGAEPYISVNVGSGTIQEARDWAEYCNSVIETDITRMRRKNGHPQSYDVKFWGIGNESWGCGGPMTPESYADLFIRFAGSVGQAARTKREETPKMIACGSTPDFPEWDERLLAALKKNGGKAKYIAPHIYASVNSSDTVFSEEEYYKMVERIDFMDKYISRVCDVIRAYSPDSEIVLDEWGTAYREAMVDSAMLCQQNTMSDAVLTALSFHCFHKYAQKVFMTNMAQTVNVLQSLILTQGSKAIVTPTYHIYEMFMPHRDSSVIACKTEGPALKLPEGKEMDSISASATISENGKEIFLSIVNVDLKNDYEIKIRIQTDKVYGIKRIRSLESGDIHDHNTFEEPGKVTVKDGASCVVRSASKERKKAKNNAERNKAIEIELPRHSVTTILLAS